MELLFRQRIFSWFDSYDIYDSSGSVMFRVKGKLAWGHRLAVYDNSGHQVGEVREKIISLLPAFEVYIHGTYRGRIQKKISLFRPKYDISFNGWKVTGNFLEWDYTIKDKKDCPVADIRKKLLNFSDTYSMTIYEPENALPVLMFVLAMDAEKCSNNND